MATTSSTRNDAWLRFRDATRRGWRNFARWSATTSSHISQRTSNAWRRWRTSPRVDMIETNDAVELRVDLPGVDADGIDIKVRSRRLTIRGRRLEACTVKGTCRRHERPSGEFTRCVTLPCHVNDEQINAHYHDGVLAISLPKKQKNETHVHVQRDMEPSAPCCQASDTTSAD